MALLLPRSLAALCRFVLHGIVWTYLKAGYTLSVFHIWCYFRRLFTENKTKRELMPLHLAYVMLFSYFCIVCENSEFCYYIFSHNFFDFLCEDHSMCESYEICEPRNAIYKKPAKTGLHISPFSRYHALWYAKVCATLWVHSRLNSSSKRCHCNTIYPIMLRLRKVGLNAP